MWSRLYRNHVLMAFPTYDSAKHAWVPQVDINWFIGPSHDSRFVRFPVRFLTEDEAVSWALSRGQAWIDIHLERLRGRAPKRRRMFELGFVPRPGMDRHTPRAPARPCAQAAAHVRHDRSVQPRSDDGAPPATSRGFSGSETGRESEPHFR